MTRSKQQGFKAGTAKGDVGELGEAAIARSARSRTMWQALGGAGYRCVSQFKTPRAWLLAGMHAAIFAGAYYVANLLRFDFAPPPKQMVLFWATLGWVVVIQLATFALLGQFRGWWRYVTFADLTALLLASVLACCMLVVVIFFFHWSPLVPRSTLILDCMLVIGILGAVRASWRMIRETFRPMVNGKDCRWALLVGTDLSSGILAHQVQSLWRLPYRIRGFLTTNGSTPDTHLGQIPILGRLEEVEEIAAQLPHPRRFGGCRHVARPAAAQPDGGLRPQRLGAEDHPLHGGPAGRRQPHPRPRHRNQRPLGPRAGAVGHGEHRPTDRRAHG